MAEDDTTTAPAPAPGGLDLNNPIIQQLLQGGGAIQGPPAPTTPAVNRNLPFTGMLGEALGGGVSPLYPMSEAQQTQAGNAALLNFGIGMLQNSSGPVRHSLGQAIASGLLGAQGSLAGVREGQAQTLDVQNKQQTMQLERLKAILPLLRMQQAAGMPNPLDSSAKAPGSLAATGAPIAAGDAPVLQRDPSIKVAGDQANNPGNLMYARGQPGVSGQLPLSGGRTLAAFPDMPTGIAANANQIMLNQDQHGINTVRGMVSRWVSDPKADLGSYTADVSKALGVDPDAPVDFHNPDVLSKFIVAQRPHESGPAALNPADVTKGVGMALAARSAPPGATRTATAPPAAMTPPAPVARPPAAPVAPPVQGVDTGSTQVGGPGALPGPIRPPGPLVPGDVKTIIGGMTGAGANAATLAPGGGTAAPTAPTIAQAAPPTVTPPAQPTPQQPTQGDQPPAPTGPMTFEQFQAQHPIAIDPRTFTVTPPNLADLQKAQAEAAQRRDLAMRGIGGDVNKAGSDYREASKAIMDAQQAAQTKSLELQQAAQKNALDTQRQLYNDEMTRQQQAQLKAQELAQTVAENEKNRQADIRKAELGAGYTAEQSERQADIDIAKSDINDRAADAQKASHIIPVLQQMQGQFGNLPGGVVGGLLAKYDTTGDITGMLARMGVVDPSKATAAQLLIAARNYLSIETKPAATGSLRVAEMDKLQSFTPGQLATPQAQQEMIGRLIAYQKRIQDERTFAGNYFGRTDPTTGKRIYDNRGLETAMNAPVQYNENGVVTGGGLGPVVPEPPPLNRSDAEHQAYLNYIHRNVAPGMPYQSWEPKTNPDGSTVRDARGQPVPQRVTKMQGYQ